MARRLLRLPAWVSLSKFKTRERSDAIHCRMKFEPMKPAPPVTKIRSSMLETPVVQCLSSELGLLAAPGRTGGAGVLRLRKNFASRSSYSAQNDINQDDNTKRVRFDSHRDQVS